jgi:peptidoglycan/xylan/chitin deacetylase (PgdA/CDA1 family)
MYHYVSVPPEDADEYRLDLSVTPDDFRAQMEYLVTNGYTTVDLYDLSLAIVNKRELPEKPVIITLDDGYLDNYQNAFPILQELGLTATFFIATDFIDQNNPNYMTWTMISEMAAAGMRFEPHSKNHPDLRDRDRDFLIWQIAGSQETLAHHIGYTPRYFAYPAGRYDGAVIDIMAELDFWGAVVTAGGKWHGFNDRFEWRRMRVRYETTMAEFADLVN